MALWSDANLSSLGETLASRSRLRKGSSVGCSMRRRARAGRGAPSARAVEVLLRILRQVVLDDPVHAFEVEPCSRHVGGDHDARAQPPEAHKRVRAITLRHLAV